MCECIELTQIQTYVASGNVVFTSNEPANAIKQATEILLKAFVVKDVGVMIRSAAEFKKY